MPGSHGSPRAAEGLLGVLVRAKRLIFTETKMDAWAAVWGLTQSAQKGSKVVVVNRQSALMSASNETDLVTRAKASVFAQMYDQLHTIPPAQLRRKDGRAWFAKFVGEPAIDDGGLFRESYSAMSEELQSGVLPLFVETANGFVPNPAASVLLEREHRRRSSGGGGGVPAQLASSMVGSVVKEWYR